MYCAGSGSLLTPGAAVAAGCEAERVEVADSGGESVATSSERSELAGVGISAGLGVLLQDAIPNKTTKTTKIGSICFCFVRFIKNSLK
jgi:hypothetical protein